MVSFQELVMASAARTSLQSRRERAKRFAREITRTHPDRDISGLSFLDLGGGDGAFTLMVAGALAIGPQQFTIADIDERDLEMAAQRGFRTVLLAEDGPLPFENKQFDVVLSNSTIEHVTGRKSDVCQLRDGKTFKRIAIQHQRLFAAEIRRLGHHYLVQTPNKYFIPESHTWLPFAAFLPRPLLLWLIRYINTHRWVKSTIGDFNLLNAREMRALFPESRIIRERFWPILWTTKSIMASF